MASEAVALLDLRAHEGVHPRLGVVDVVPFVALRGSTMADAVAARDAFAAWAAAELALPSFLYGPGEGDPTLPELRRDAWTVRRPDRGPARPHPTAGAVCVGARPVLVAYNVWLAGGDVGRARQVATAVRRPAIRALGLAVGDRTQVSMNLVTPVSSVRPPLTTSSRTRRAPQERRWRAPNWSGSCPRPCWGSAAGALAQLDLAADRTIEARLGRPASTGTRPAGQSA